MKGSILCVEGGLSVLYKEELEEPVGVTTCRSVLAVFFLSSSQSQSEGGKKGKKDKETLTNKTSAKEAVNNHSKHLTLFAYNTKFLTCGQFNSIWHRGIPFLLH